MSKYTLPPIRKSEVQALRRAMGQGATVGDVKSALRVLFDWIGRADVEVVEDDASYQGERSIIRRGRIIDIDL